MEGEADVTDSGGSLNSDRAAPLPEDFRILQSSAAHHEPDPLLDFSWLSRRQLVMVG